MSAPLNHLVVWTLSPAQSLRGFVEFWAERYNDVGESQYRENLGNPSILPSTPRPLPVEDRQILIPPA